jgi:hypothetical protein
LDYQSLFDLRSFLEDVHSPFFSTVDLGGNKASVMKNASILEMREEARQSTKVVYTMNLSEKVSDKT